MGAHGINIRSLFAVRCSLFAVRGSLETGNWKLVRLRAVALRRDNLRAHL
jgi:hypothetical protein